MTPKTGVSGFFVPINRYFRAFGGFCGDWHARCIILATTLAVRFRRFPAVIWTALLGLPGLRKKKLKIVVASRKGLCDIDAMKNEQGMSEIAKIETRFLAWARAHGLNHKVAGDTAYSSRAMGMGRYAKLVSAKGGQLLIAVDGKRVTA